jgi:hypothetical protein
MGCSIGSRRLYSIGIRNENGHRQQNSLSIASRNEDEHKQQDNGAPQQHYDILPIGSRLFSIGCSTILLSGAACMHGNMWFACVIRLVHCQRYRRVVK